MCLVVSMHEGQLGAGAKKESRELSLLVAWRLRGPWSEGSQHWAMSGNSLFLKVDRGPKNVSVLFH